jgi:hypothetical protein
MPGKVVYAVYRLHYHQHALSLAKTASIYSTEAALQISQILAPLRVTLPLSIAEWLCLDPDARLFQQMTQLPHDFVRISDLPNHIARRQFGGSDVFALDLIFENQGCFVMAASLEDGDDPPVWISSDFYFCGSDAPTWSFHSSSFSDCIKAFAWDFNCLDTPDGTERFQEGAAIPADIEPTAYGPTTYICSAWFKSREFRRMVVNNERLTFMLDERYGSIEQVQ